MSQEQLPGSLIAVAVLFIISGLSAVLDVIWSLMHHHLSINLGVLGLFVGIGLLRLSGGWRTCGLVLLWIGMILVPLVALLFMLHGGPLDVTVFRQHVGHASVAMGLLLAGGIFVLLCWMYFVLTRPDVRRLFGLT